jgi:hypothetical protein
MLSMLRYYGAFLVAKAVRLAGKLSAFMKQGPK